MKEFRQLTVDDAAEYHEVLIAGYAENKNYPISFDAINFSQEESRAWIFKISCIRSLRRWLLGMLYFIPHALDSKSYTRCIPAYCALCDGPLNIRERAMLVKSSPKQKTYCATYIKHQP